MNDVQENNYVQCKFAEHFVFPKCNGTVCIDRHEISNNDTIS